MTLAITCMFMAAWMRSHHKYDFLWIANGNRLYTFASRGGFIALERESPHFGKFEWRSGDILTVRHWFDETGRPELWEGCDIEWNRRWGDFEAGVGTTILIRPRERKVACQFPYYSIVVPLTLLSAWLLVSTPRSSTVEQTGNPAPEMPM